jgi:RHS repeat-associated protein
VTLLLEDGATQLFSKTLTLPEIAIDRLTLSYETLSGSTVQPVLRQNGVAIATGAATTQGNGNKLTFTINSPGWPIDSTVYPRLIAGEHHGIYFDVNQSSQRFLDERTQQLVDATNLIGTPSADTDDLIGELLYIALLKYNMNVNEALEMVDDFYKTVTVPAQMRIGVTKAGANPDYLSALPYGIFPDKLYIDFKRNVIGQFSVDGPISAELAQKTMRLGGYVVSALEHQIWEELVRVDAISTMKGLQYANEIGIPIKTCTNASCLDSTQLSQATKDAILPRINGGWHIIVPNDEFTYNEWNGAVWIAYDPATWAASYIISGGFDGGATTQSGSPATESVGDLGSSNGVMAGDPVNITNGNEVRTEVDFTIPGRGLAVNWTRTYNSRLAYDGPLGYGWTHNYNMHLNIAGNGDVTLFDTDGAQQLFTKSGSTYTPPAGLYDTLTKPGDYILRETTGTEYRFNSSGQLLSITDRNGNQLTLTYSGGNLTGITDAVGRQLTLTYDGSRLTNVADFAGRNWTYAYDANGDLVSYTDALGHTTTYTYYSDQYFADNNHNLKLVTGPLGESMFFAYYPNDKVYWHENSLGERMTFSYNPFWKATTVIDERGVVTEHLYDENSHLIQKVDGAGNIWTYTWNAAHLLESETDPLGRTTSYDYDERGNIVQITDPAGQISTFSYTNDFNLLAESNQSGRITTYTYDGNGNVIGKTDPTGASTQWSYDTHGQMLTRTDARGHTTSYAYDAGRGDFTLRFVTDAAGNVTEHQYDNIGRRIRTINARGFTTEMVYDHNDQMTQLIDALGNMLTTEFDAAGNMIRMVDQRGFATTYEYDTANRLIRETSAAGDVTTYTYDGVGNVLTVAAPNDGLTSHTYDAVGNRSQTVDALGNITNYAYDAVGNLLRVIDAEGRVTTTAYDELDRPVTVTNAAGASRLMAYDAFGNLLQVTDENGHLVSYTYDGRNRTLTATDGVGNTTHYTYDDVGNLTHIYDANQGLSGTPIHFVYDNLNRLVNSIDQTGKTTSYAYDAVGNRISITSPNNETVTLAYDALNRLQERTYPNGEQDLFTYDEAGNMLTAVNAEGFTYVYQYDEMSRLTQIYDSRFNKAIQYGYNELGLTATMTDPEGDWYTYEYDLLGQLVEMADPHGDTTFFTYDATGLRLSRSMDSGSETTYDYDAVGRLETIRNLTADGSTFNTFSYTYDDAGRLTGENGPQGSRTYSYYDNNELFRIDYQNGDFEQYTYDAVGNRLVKEFQNGAGYLTKFSRYTYDNANRMVIGDFEEHTDYNGDSPEFPIPTSATAYRSIYGYDDNGNLTSINEAGEITTFNWDVRNRLIGIQYPDGTPDSVMAYDAFGNRVAHTDTGGMTQFFYGAGKNVITEYDGSSAFLARNVFGPTTDEMLSRSSSSGGTYYYHLDRLNSVTGISDAAGAVIGSTQFHPFGEVTAQTGGADNPYGFTGRRLDSDSGLMYYRTRYYAPDMGRFISQDTIGYEGGLNLYAYALNNPLSYVDPLGTTAQPGAAPPRTAPLPAMEFSEFQQNVTGVLGGTEAGILIHGATTSLDMMSQATSATPGSTLRPAMQGLSAGIKKVSGPLGYIDQAVQISEAYDTGNNEMVMREVVGLGGNLAGAYLGGLAGGLCGPAAFICVPVGAAVGGAIAERLVEDSYSRRHTVPVDTSLNPAEFGP